MKEDIFKRAGMLAASTAVCCGVVFGGLSMNGLRYVRPTAENWTLLAYMQPAARIEQQKTTRVIPDEKEWSYLRITGYDAQNREIWSLNCKRPFGVSSNERKVYSGSKMTWYSTTCGVKTVSYTEYDEQGAYHSHSECGRNRDLHLSRRRGRTVSEAELRHGRQHAVTGGVGIQSQNRRNDQNQHDFRGRADRHMDHGEGCTRGSILRMENNVHDPNYEMMQDNKWTYDDTERTAVCVSRDGVTEKIWYDEQQRVLRDEYYTPDGILQTCTVNDFFDITR